MRLGAALEHGAAVWILGHLRYATPAGLADVDALRGQQPQAVLARLALSERAPVASTDLAAAVWGDHRPRSWETTLRSVVSRLRAQLLSAAWPAADPIPSTLSGYTLTANGPLWLDAAYARHAVSGAETALADGDFGRAATAGEAAWQLARHAPILSTATAFGARLTREMLGTAHRAAIVTARAWLSAGDPDFASHFAHGAIDVAAYRETGWRVLMEAHAHRNDTAAVAATFDEMVTLLEVDLGVSPHATSFALYRRLIASGRRGANTGEHRSREV